MADFSYDDTSGEPRDQTHEHRARVEAFGQLLRESLAAQGRYEARRLDCASAGCTTASMSPDDLAAAARRAGARLLITGGIHKMSTLIQWAEVRLVDLDTNEVLLTRRFSFRGDNDLAFQRAAKFVGETLVDAMPKP